MKIPDGQYQRPNLKDITYEDIDLKKNWQEFDIKHELLTEAYSNLPKTEIILSLNNMYYATANEMEKLDNLAVKNGLDIIQMMELAGFQMVNLFHLLKVPKKSKVLVVCGKGNNGGDGLSAARFLINNGWKVSVILAETGLNNNAEHHLRLLEKMKADIITFNKNKPQVAKLVEQADVIIDALFGYHIKGNPKNPYNKIINLVNGSTAKVITYDLPSGMDGTGGNCFQPCVKADYTLTLALPKRAFKTQSGKKQSGQVYVADIGIPEFLYDKIRKHSRPNFSQTLIKL